MDTTRATDILRSLADGRDPATGEQFPPNSPYQQADTVRALHVALDALSATSAPLREKSDSPRRPTDPNRPKLGTAWTHEEEQQLRDAFAAHKPVPEIASAHGRSRGAITSRLVKLGLLENNATNRAGHGHAPTTSSSPQGPTSPKSPTAPAEDDTCPF